MLKSSEMYARDKPEKKIEAKGRQLAFNAGLDGQPVKCRGGVAWSRFLDFTTRHAAEFWTFCSL